MFSLNGKTAVITGGSSGIGLATTRRFAEAGAYVVIADKSDASELASELGGLYVQTDVTQEEQIKNLMAKAVEAHGRIDILINNAGGGAVSKYDFIQLLSAEDFNTCYNLNLMGPVFGIKHAVQYMTHGGAIVNVASIAGYQGAPTYGPYVAAKAAVIGITRTAALELAHKNIRVNCICPATIDTPLAHRAGVEHELKIAPIIIPLGRIGKPEEVAALYHFLVADDCSFVSGQIICIDGGMTAGMCMSVAFSLLNNS
jgi:NAD(P)-dependent dehydrogenase (short-subunit alcohol dehydrogenase family)